MDRRSFVKAITGALGVAAKHATSVRAEEIRRPRSVIKAIAFDGFVIFDPHSVERRVEEQLPGKGAEFTNLWRTRQFEYSWLRTEAGRYADFWQGTEDALRYAAKNLRIVLSDTQRGVLMDAYRKLAPWPDVQEGLAQLRRRGVRMAFLSNFSGAMLDANLRAAGLSEFFEPHLTTDRVQAYKPAHELTRWVWMRLDCESRRLRLQRSLRGRRPGRSGSATRPCG